MANEKQVSTEAIEQVEKMMRDPATITDISELREALKKAQGLLSSLICDREGLKNTLNDTYRIMHNMVVAEQAAWIEWRHGQGAETAMIWIENGLLGPGHIPDEDGPNGKDAQAFFNANVSYGESIQGGKNGKN